MNFLEWIGGGIVILSFIILLFGKTLADLFEDFCKALEE